MVSFISAIKDQGLDAGCGTPARPHIYEHAEKVEKLACHATKTILNYLSIGLVAWHANFS